MVLTSPPYYNIELYPEMVAKSDIEWGHWYAQIFSKTFGALQKGGHFCINVSKPIYEKELVPMLGPAMDSQPMKGYLNAKYREYVYVWKKEAELPP